MILTTDKMRLGRPLGGPQSKTARPNARDNQAAGLCLTASANRQAFQAALSCCPHLVHNWHPQQLVDSIFYTSILNPHTHWWH